jgi:hypothetical protein
MLTTVRPCASTPPPVAAGGAGDAGFGRKSYEKCVFDLPGQHAYNLTVGTGNVNCLLIVYRSSLAAGPTTADHRS